MLVFLDTEYTDEHRRDLVSIGMVTEDAQRSLYLERTDFSRTWCNHFVVANVLPHLGNDPVALCITPELGQRLHAWFQVLPRRVQLACDSPIDRDLLKTAMGGAMPANVNPLPYDLRPLIDTTVYDKAVARYHEHPAHPWHHALHDAYAHRAGWLAWTDRNRAGRT
ncbi:hypothetical protein ACXU4B_06130 [Dyella soli]|uniref:Uncharacterized protein n=1 Tax=Dyella soli TaxID=522319 RepID=A0A4R0YUN9_9GAMM|nr:hypothetical protein [Dyella soli]TCI10568.1 hypothetical protein EZM97_17020 [Dyella soli]